MPRHFAIVPAAGAGTLRRRDAEAVSAASPVVLRSSIRCAVLCRSPHDRVMVVLAPDDMHWRTHDWRDSGRNWKRSTLGGARPAEACSVGLMRWRQRLPTTTGCSGTMRHGPPVAGNDRRAGGGTRYRRGGRPARGAGRRLPRKRADPEQQGPPPSRATACGRRRHRRCSATARVVAGDTRCARRRPRVPTRRWRSKPPAPARSWARRCHQLKVTSSGRPVAGGTDCLQGGSMMRIGQGFDVHALVPGRKMIIGGVEIAHDKYWAFRRRRTVACGDGCAVRAAALGRHRASLSRIPTSAGGRRQPRAAAGDRRFARTGGLAVVNVDRRSSPSSRRWRVHPKRWFKNIASDLRIANGEVNVKAKTANDPGFTGRGGD